METQLFIDQNSRQNQSPDPTIRHQFWAHQLNLGGCGEQIDFNIYKGTAGEITENPIMNCSERNDCFVTNPLPMHLHFFKNGDEIGRADYIAKSGCCGEVVHRLLVPDVTEERRIAEIISTPVIGTKKLTVNAMPFFKSVDGYSATIKTVIYFLLGICVLATLSSNLFINNLVMFFTIEGCGLFGLLIVITILLCWRLQPSPGGKKRMMLYKLVSPNGQKFADIYSVSMNCCCNTCFIFEFDCYEDINDYQLMTLVTVAIRSGYAIFKYYSKLKIDSNFVNFNNLLLQNT